MFWINTDKAVPAYSCDIVKIKVVDYGDFKDYITKGWYDHQKELWYSIDGYCLYDHVCAWKHTRPTKRMNSTERNALIAKWE